MGEEASWQFATAASRRKVSKRRILLRGMGEGWGEGGGWVLMKGEGEGDVWRGDVLQWWFLDFGSCLAAWMFGWAN